MPFANKIKDVFSYPKLFLVFLHHFWFWRRFLKEMLFLAQFGTLCAFDEGVVHKMRKALTQATCVQKIKFLGVVVFEKRFEAIIDGTAYKYERPCWHGIMREEILLS
jgi:hypothetical protein